MKKLAFVLILVLLFPVVACAEVDLSALTYAELLDLQSSINAEIVTREEFKQATVPAGSYIVGEDIPAGTYTLSLGEGSFMAIIDVNNYDTVHSITSDSSVGKIVLSDNDTVEISAGSILFKTYSGLGF